MGGIRLLHGDMIHFASPSQVEAVDTTVSMDHIFLCDRTSLIMPIKGSGRCGKYNWAGIRDAPKGCPDKNGGEGWGDGPVPDVMYLCHVGFAGC